MTCGMPCAIQVNGWMYTGYLALQVHWGEMKFGGTSGTSMTSARPPRLKLTNGYGKRIPEKKPAALGANLRSPTVPNIEKS